MGRVAIALLLTFGAGCTCAARHVDDAGGVGLDAGRPGLDAGVDGTDAGLDAGPPIPDADVVRTCLQALDAPLGARCAIEPDDRPCLGGDLCCSVDARCWDGRLQSVRRPETCEGELRPTGCAPTPADVRGSTPRGDVAFTSVFASFTFAFAVDVALVFTPGDSFAICDGDRLGLWLLPHSEPDTGELTYVGVHDTVATLVVDGALEIARAVVEIERYDLGDDAPNGRLAGRFTIDAWGIATDFDVEGCAEIDRSGP